MDSYGCYLAITTIGGRGAIVYNGRKFYRKLPYNFAGGVIDTTGAGDSWITGFISSYIDNMKKMEILKKNSPDNFLSQSDVEDFEDHVIEQNSFCHFVTAFLKWTTFSKRTFYQTISSRQQVS